MRRRELEAVGEIASSFAARRSLRRFGALTVPERITRQVEALDSEELSIPLGSLTGFATASDLGPVLPVRVLTAAVPTADFENVFTSAGINQTLHRIMLNVLVECTLLIPGGTVDTAVEAQVCAAETLLVGQVPDAYLELPGSP